MELSAEPRFFPLIPQGTADQTLATIGNNGKVPLWLEIFTAYVDVTGMTRRLEGVLLDTQPHFSKRMTDEMNF